MRSGRIPNPVRDTDRRQEEEEQHAHPAQAPREQVIVITGASSGIGLATALAAAPARRPRGPGGAQRRRPRRIAHDITGARRRGPGRRDRRVSARTCEAPGRRGGRGPTAASTPGSTTPASRSSGRLEEVSRRGPSPAVRRQFLGDRLRLAWRRSQHLQDGRRADQSRLVASDLAFPIQGMYCASKHAVKGFTDALRMELRGGGRPGLGDAHQAGVDRHALSAARQELHGAARNCRRPSMTRRMSRRRSCMPPSTARGTSMSAAAAR